MTFKEWMVLLRSMLQNSYWQNAALLIASCVTPAYLVGQYSICSTQTYIYLDSESSTWNMLTLFVKHLIHDQILVFL